MIKVCAICGTTFEVNNKTKYCSENCKKEAHLEAIKKYRKNNLKSITRRCNICGSLFTAKKGNHKTCSVECRKINRKHNITGERILPNDMITYCIQRQFSSRKDKLKTVWNDAVNNKFLALKLNINKPSIDAVEQGTCSLDIYRTIINKVDQIINLYGS
jgi:predicted nucleic acid-binding Zn ribbon protein